MELVKKVTRRKKIIFILILLLFTYSLAEILSLALFNIIAWEHFSFSKHQMERMFIKQNPTSKGPPVGGIVDYGNITEVIHPYLGFVRDPKKMEDHSEYGFPGKIPPISEKKANNIIIGIFGGSFAEEFSKHGRNALLIELKKSPKFYNKKFIVHTLALGGYKQPQQLITLIYLLALGANFDIVINIDGFNEVALPPTENIPKKTFPFYPREWNARVQNFSGPKMLILLGEIYILGERRKNWAKLFSSVPLRYSIMSNIIWKYYDVQIFNKVNSKKLAFQKHEVNRREDVGYIGTGPLFHFDNEVDLYEELTNYWLRSSIQMDRISKANNIAYFHILQPNLYVQGSKVMSERELKIASFKNPYKRGVEMGYPILSQKGQDLKNQGLNFNNLTMFFSNDGENFYRDCCHFNKRGYSLIGAKVGRIIVEYFGEKESQKGKG